jgi:hypothetical protein
MGAVFWFSFLHWLKQHGFLIPNNERTPKRTIYGNKSDMAQYLHNSCVFKEFKDSKFQRININDWFKRYLRDYESIRVDTSRLHDPSTTDGDIMVTRALNTNIDKLRALLELLFESNPTVLAAAIQICQLSITNAQYRAYREAHVTALETAQGERMGSMHRFSYYNDPTPCPANLLEEPALEVLIKYMDNSGDELHSDDSYSVGDFDCCAPDDRYLKAEISLPLSRLPNNKIAVNLSGGGRVDTDINEGLFMPCNVLYKLPHTMFKETSYYAIILRANTQPSLGDTWGFKPLIFTLTELSSLQKNASRNLALVQRNVSALRFGTVGTVLPIDPKQYHVVGIPP